MTCCVEGTLDISMKALLLCRTILVRSRIQDHISFIRPQPDLNPMTIPIGQVRFKAPTWKQYSGILLKIPSTYFQLRILKISMMMAWMTIIMLGCVFQETCRLGGVIPPWLQIPPLFQILQHVTFNGIINNGIIEIPVYAQSGINT